MNKFTAILLVLFVLVTVGFFVVLSKYLGARAAEAAANVTKAQNAAAYEAQLHQKADSVQNLASFVGQLNDSLTGEQKKTRYWRAVAQNTQIIIDTIQHEGPGIPSTGEDSLGKYVKVDLEGKEGIVSYTGWTKYYVTLLSSGYFLQLGFDIIPLSTQLYQDVDGIWKIRVETKAPGIRLTTTSTIDSTIFIGMRSAVEGQFQKARHYLPPLGFRFKGNVAFKAVDLQRNQFNNVSLDASAELYYKSYNITYYPLWGTVSGGLVYTFDLGQFIESIF